MTREGKRRGPIGPGTEVQVLDQALNETARRLRQAYGAFDLVTDPDLLTLGVNPLNALVLGILGAPGLALLCALNVLTG